MTATASPSPSPLRAIPRPDEAEALGTPEQRGGLRSNDRARRTGGASYRPRVRKSPPGSWTNERILAALRDWFDTFGATPLSYEWSPRSAELLGLPQARGREWMRQYPRWPSTATVCRHFDSWSAAVRAAQLPPPRVVAPRRGLAERVLAAPRLSAAGYGTSEIAALLEVSVRTVRNYLRAGRCRDCGMPVVISDRCPRCAARRANQPQWTRRDVIRAMKAWVSEQGAAPTVADWTPTADTTRKWAHEYPGWPGYETVRTLFGSWRKGLAAAGLRPRRRRWDRDAIKAALREFAAAHDRRPTAADLVNDDTLPAPGTVRSHLGSFAEALEASDLSVSRRRWSQDRIVGAVLRHEQEHGRLPTSRDWSRSTPDHPHATTVLQQFGSWSAAIAAASSRGPSATDESSGDFQG